MPMFEKVQPIGQQLLKVWVVYMVGCSGASSSAPPGSLGAGTPAPIASLAERPVDTAAVPPAAGTAAIATLSSQSKPASEIPVWGAVAGSGSPSQPRDPVIERAAVAGAGAAPVVEGPSTEAAEPELSEILGMDWELAAGTEKYLCLRATVPKTAYFQRLRPVLAAGTHHMGLMVSQTADAPNGSSECSIVETGERMLASGGPGTQDLELPPGVAMRLDKGEALLLQLHLFNVGTATLRGHTGVEALEIAPEAVKFEAEHVPAQLLALNIPHGKTSVRGRCTFDRAQTLLGLLPHMHGMGRHMKVSLHTASGDRVLHDADFEFMEQRRYPLPQVQVAPGDYLDYECSYDNDSDRTRVWGESSNDEMCMVGTLRYPGSKQTTPIMCLF